MKRILAWNNGRVLIMGYVLALCIIAMMACGGYFVLSQSIEQQARDGAIINVSGKQRMLSQRIAFYGSQLTLAQSAEEISNVRAKLLSAIDTMGLAHNSLTGKAVAHNFDISDSVNALYFSPEHNIDAEVTTFLQHARNVATAQDIDALSNNPSYLHIVNAADDSLLNKLDAVVTQLEADYAAKIAKLAFIEQMILISTLVVLILEVLFIFKPIRQNISKIFEQLHNVNKLKAQFLANMSHEIRTPMNGIFGMAEQLSNSNLDAHQQYQLKTLTHSADDLMIIIDDILDYAKIEAGELGLDPISFNLRSACEDVADIMAEKARAKNIELMVRYVPGTPQWIVGDPGRIRQVLCNLISNAIKFTNEGYVLVKIEKNQTLYDNTGHLPISISVEDTGIGISPKNLDDIFEHFSQIDNSHTRLSRGVGLGLSLCQRVASLMQGHIEVQSNFGEGSVFSFHFNAMVAKVGKNTEIRHSILYQLRVLIVDDLESNRTLLCEQLTKAGMECDQAESAHKAFKMLNEAKAQEKLYDIIIMDYVMPNTNGEEATRRIKKHEDFKDIPIIVLSSAGERGYSKLFVDAGADAFLAKPIRSEALLNSCAMVWQNKLNGGRHPLITKHALSSAKHAHLENALSPFKGACILLVEDNRINREITQNILEEFGAVVSCACNGKEAIRQLRNTKKTDLIFMDCQMPVMDGFEATRHINAMKASGEIDNIPIVALTANALSGDRERCLVAGMDDYVSKPIKKEALLHVLATWLNDKANIASVIHMPKNQSNTSAVDIMLPDSVLPSDIEAAKPLSKVMDLMRSQHANSDETQLLDIEALQMTRDVMGDKFLEVLEYYHEDTQDFIEDIELALNDHDFSAVRAAAHPLKSSSQQFGFAVVSVLAQNIEYAVTDYNETQGIDWTHIRHSLAKLIIQYQETTKALKIWLKNNEAA